MEENEPLEREPLKNNDKLDVLEQRKKDSSEDQQIPSPESETDGMAKPASESAKNSK